MAERESPNLKVTSSILVAGKIIFLYFQFQKVASSILVAGEIYFLIFSISKLTFCWLYRILLLRVNELLTDPDSPSH